MKGEAGLEGVWGKGSFFKSATPGLTRKGCERSLNLCQETFTVLQCGPLAILCFSQGWGSGPGTLSDE